MFSKKFCFSFLVTVLSVSSVFAIVDTNFHCYLLFGQSNMAGGGATSNLITADCDTSSRVKVFAFCNCPTSGSGTWTSSDCNQYIKQRKADSMYTAYPPLHICSEGISPGDWFAKTMLDSIRSDIKIGLIPCALSGMGMDVFMKGYSGSDTIPSWAHPTIGKSSAYTWMLNRCQLAQKTGVIKGILLHQGESNVGSNPNSSLSWIAMTKGVLDTLKKDLGLDSTVPVAVGELRQDSTVTPLPCCAGFNKNIDSLAKIYPHCALVSSKGVSGNGSDVYHFSAAGMREMGKRYANALLSISSSSYIARRTSSNIINNERTALYNNMKSAKSDIMVYSINGRVIRSIPASKAESEIHNLNARGVYIVSRKLANGNTLMLPYINQ